RFVDNAPEPNQTVIAFQRSPHAHATIVAIDADAARAMPGVLAVYTGAELAAAGVKPLPTSPDFRRADGDKAASPPRRALAHERVRYVGEAVVVEYEELGAVTDVEQATTAGAPALVDRAADNIAAEIRHGDAAAAGAAFARAAVTVALDIVNQRVAPVALEPRSVVASFDGASGAFTVRISNQMPTAVAAGLAGALPDTTQQQVRVVVGDVGGGFGMKTGAYPEDIVVAFAARALGRPVHWQSDRSEEFLSASHGRDLTSRAELALDANGKALALRVRSRANVGAYPTPAGIAIQLMIGPWVSTSIYDIPTIDFHLQAVLTNTTPTGPYRGAGRPEAVYVIERLFDAAAREMKLDPAELRRRNMIQ